MICSAGVIERLIGKMKLAILLIALMPFALQAGAPEAQPDAWMIKGHVVSVLHDGLLISCVDDGTVRMKKPKGGDIVFVKGKFAFSKGDAVNFTGEPAGTFKYESPGSAARTLRAFEVRH